MYDCVATVENNLAVPPKLKIEFADEPEIPLLGMYLRSLKTSVQSKTCTQVLRAA
jgi:hypothetical protein